MRYNPGFGPGFFMNDHLEDAFCRTDYRVALDGSWLTLNIGAPCPQELAHWLDAQNSQKPAWLITACNPGAERLFEARNAARTAVLRQWAQTHDCAILDTVNRDPNGHWPDEPGLLITGVGEEMARAIALRLGQLALVAVSADAPVALIWLSRQSDRDHAAGRYDRGSFA